MKDTELEAAMPTSRSATSLMRDERYGTRGGDAYASLRDKPRPSFHHPRSLSTACGPSIRRPGRPAHPVCLATGRHAARLPDAGPAHPVSSSSDGNSTRTSAGASSAGTGCTNHGRRAAAAAAASGPARTRPLAANLASGPESDASTAAAGTCY